MKIQDQLGNLVEVPEFPERIVSLVPSQTELLHYLDVDERVIGITKFCIHPDEWFRTKTRVGGTKSLDIEKLKDLEPDLIIGNKEENTKEDIDALIEIAPVWMSDVNSIPEALDMVKAVGRMTNTLEKAEILIKDIQSSFNASDDSPKKSVIYYIWNEPDYAAGTKTFIHSMIEASGFENLIEKERYPEVQNGLSPDFIFLSSEPYPFKEEHIKKFQEKHPESKVILVDGEMFSWYGSRMKEAGKYFENLRKSI
jgi:ABC-type Fe3+-hydroxamate transport system substrate-binding protein